ncbi:MAG: type II secretion system protein GspG [Planctomycetota bacterium]
MLRQRRRARAGFTILEVLIVLVIIGLIAGIVGLNLVGAAGKARVSTTQATMGNVASALKMYNANYGTYPSGTTGAFPMELLQENLLDADGEPVDAWGRPFLYYSPAQEHAWELVSLGEDGQEYTEDDIVLYPKN